MILGNNISFYDIKISGKNVKRFVHNLHKMHIELLNIVFEKNSVTIKVSESDYKKILEIKTIYKIEVVKVCGIAYLKHFFKKYCLFLTILLLGCLMFIGLTNVIFEIEVVHNNKELRELILEELDKEGIHKYGIVVSYKEKEKIKSNVLKKYKDQIEWLEIERQGTKYVVKVEERKKNQNIQNNTPQNVVAKKEGMIKKITSSSGEILVKKDQYVKKGDILIGGIIHNKEKEMARVRAEGVVYAETWYTVTVELPYHYHEEKKLDNYQRIVDIKWFHHSYHWFNFKKFKNSEESTILKLQNNLLPISISLVKEQEVEQIDKVYTKDNAVSATSDIAQKRVKERLGTDIEILYEKNLKITEEDSKIVVVMFYKVYEDITDYQEIPEQIEETTPEQ